MSLIHFRQNELPDSFKMSGGGREGGLRGGCLAKEF